MHFETIYRTCCPDVRRRLRNLGVMEKDVPDVTHDVFLIVHRKLPTFEQRSEVRTWVIGITRRVAADYRQRASTRREVLESEAGAGYTSAFDIDAHVEAKQLRAQIAAAVARLDLKKRSVVVEHALEEKPMLDVARKLRVPLQTAYARLYAGHRALRALLDSGEWLTGAQQGVRRLGPPMHQ